MVDIKQEDVFIVYSENGWDGVTLAGHAWYEGNYCYVTSNDPMSDTIEYTLYKLEGQNLINALASRKLFEDMVGYHWTNNVKEGCVHTTVTSETRKSFYSGHKNLVPSVDPKTLEVIGTYTL